jgi:hypothetical protein
VPVKLSQIRNIGQETGERILGLPIKFQDIIIDTFSFLGMDSQQKVQPSSDNLSDFEISFEIDF